MGTSLSLPHLLACAHVIPSACEPFLCLYPLKFYLTFN